MSMFLFIMLTFSILMLIQFNEPLMMTLMTVFISLLTAMIIAIMNNSFWFSYIMFLIFTGGLFILFIYMSSFSSNKFYQFKFNKFYMNMFILMSITVFIWMYFNMSYYMNLEMMNYQQMIKLFNVELENNTNLSKMFNKHSAILTFIFMNYLLIVLIIVTKIISYYQGPLRLKI